MTPEATHAYVGRHPVCKHMRAAVVDMQDAEGRKWTAIEVAAFLKDGMEIERVSVSEVREHFAKDKCAICEPEKRK